VSKERKPKRVVPKGKLNGRATSHVIPPRRVPPQITPRPHAAMLGTIAILVVALIGVILSTSLSDQITNLLRGPTGGHGQVVDGIPCQTSEQADYHVHAHLSILDNGEPVSIPANVGMTPNCLYWLHTHDASGVIHVEAQSQRAFTLGQFFDVWGQPLNGGNVAGHRGTVTAFVDQQPFIGDPRSIPLTDRKSITLEIGKVVPPPANYDFSGTE
jgi:hypothetical protein